MAGLVCFRIENGIVVPNHRHQKVLLSAVARQMELMLNVLWYCRARCETWQPCFQ